MCPVGIRHVFSNVLCYSFFSKVLREWSLDTRKLVQCVCFTNTGGIGRRKKGVRGSGLIAVQPGEGVIWSKHSADCEVPTVLAGFYLYLTWNVKAALEVKFQVKGCFFYTFNLSNVKCGGFWDWQMSYFFLESYSLHHHTKPFWRNIIVLWPFNISPFRFIRWLPHLMMDGGSK